MDWKNNVSYAIIYDNRKFVKQDFYCCEKDFNNENNEYKEQHG